MGSHRTADKSSTWLNSGVTEKMNQPHLSNQQATVEDNTGRNKNSLAI